MGCHWRCYASGSILVMENILRQRRAGVLAHITSLPGTEGNGTLGLDAYRFVDFLHDAGMAVWQVLPVGPTLADASPYQSPSSYAGNPKLISIDRLVEWGWLEGDEFPDEHSETHSRLLRAACLHFQQNASDDDRNSYQQFLENNRRWLEPYAFFQALKGLHDGAPWWLWEAGLRDRDLEALDHARGPLASSIAHQRFEQFVFDRQWHELKDYANNKGIHLFGDIPIFVAEDSAEVWACRSFFDLDENGRPNNVAGVPPDYFSETGQRWGNPLYNWAAMEEDNFSWWVDRLRRQFELFDVVRIDHFKGFEAFWQIPSSCKTAMEGEWVKAPGEALFNVLKDQLGELPIVAEDLGIITDAVSALRKRVKMPGMKILQFAFGGGASNPYLPHNHDHDCVVYTGTHDNDTTCGWYQSLEDQDHAYIAEYLGESSEDMPWPLIRAALASVAELAVIPMQDLMALGSEHRMNVPGVTEGNWAWRFHWHDVDDALSVTLAKMIHIYGRDA